MGRIRKRLFYFILISFRFAAGVYKDFLLPLCGLENKSNLCAFPTIIQIHRQQTEKKNRDKILCLSVVAKKKKRKKKEKKARAKNIPGVCNSLGPKICLCHHLPFLRSKKKQGCFIDKGQQQQQQNSDFFKRKPNRLPLFPSLKPQSTVSPSLWLLLKAVRCTESDFAS